MINGQLFPFGNYFLLPSLDQICFKWQQVDNPFDLMVCPRDASDIRFVTKTKPAVNSGSLHIAPKQLMTLSLSISRPFFALV